MSSASSFVPSSLDARQLKLVDTLVALALEEDVSSGDVTTQATVAQSSRARGVFLAKDDGVLSGLEVATYVFQKIDPTIEVRWDAKDGQEITKGTVFGHAVGSTRSLLVAERLVLNILQRMSGIASATALYVRTMASEHTKLLDTRKTAPGMRVLDKLAVAHGGGVNHRMGLYDMAMAKDNHIEAAGGVAPAVDAIVRHLEAERAAGRGLNPQGKPIEVEVEARTLEEVRAVVACGARVQRVLLDNMVRLSDDTVDTSVLEQALEIIRQAGLNQGASRLLTEASGNVNLRTIGAIGKTGVDFVSVGALTHSVTALDISMKIKREEA